MVNIEVGNAENLRGLLDEDLQILLNQVLSEKFRRRRRVVPTNNSSAVEDEPTPEPEVVSWKQALEALKGTYSDDTQLAARTSYMWRMLYNSITHGRSTIVGRCTECNYAPAKQKPGVWGRHDPGCPSRTRDEVKTIVFTKESLIMNAGSVRSTRQQPRARRDFTLLLEALGVERQE